MKKKAVQQIGCFQITMDDPVFVQMRDGHQQLPDQTFHLRKGPGSVLVFQDVIDILVTELHYHIDAVSIFSDNDIFLSDNVLMFDGHESLDFPNRRDRKTGL